MFSSNSSQVSSAVNYIEDVFSCFLYTGTGAALTITNNIDLSTKGGAVWVKCRNDTNPNVLYDTVRGVGYKVIPNATNAQSYNSDTITAFNSNGFSLGADVNGFVNYSTLTYVSWTLRKQPKFFDVVTYTGTGSNTTIAHSLGSVPGSIIVKRTDTAADWAVYHRSLANTQYLVLNTTAAAATGATWWNSTTPTSAVFSVGTDATVNASGGTYIAYVFAHDAGGFGLTGTDNVISCGSFSTTGSTDEVNVNLGYEPQWVLMKKYNASSAGFYDNWTIIDTMRGMAYTSSANLYANKSDAEAVWSSYDSGLLTATGFTVIPSANVAVTTNSSYIYIAIRRGPMKVPTLGTSVFYPVTYTGSSGNQSITGVGFPPDLFMANWRASPKGNFEDRLRGTDPYLQSTSTGAEATGATNIVSYNMSGITLGVNNLNNKDGASFIGYFYQRAPSFFDEVCYTGNGSTQTITHNLGVTPELIIAKNRGQAGNNWPVLFNFASTTMNYGFLNLTNSCPNDTYANVGVFSAAPTSTSMFLVSSGSMNASGYGIVAYLFATCAGVSKVGSYTGNGTTQTINCGFTGGARFVLIKRTDSTGDWYTYDTARGMTVLTDPYLLLNDTAAEVATLGSVTTVSTGFAVNNAILAGINAASPAAYIFLAIA